MKLGLRVKTFGNATPTVAVKTGNKVQWDVKSPTITAMADCHLPSVHLLCTITVTSGTLNSKATGVLLWCVITKLHHQLLAWPGMHTTQFSVIFLCACRFFSQHCHICRFFFCFQRKGKTFGIRRCPSPFCKLHS